MQIGAGAGIVVQLRNNIASVTQHSCVRENGKPSLPARSWFPPSAHDSAVSAGNEQVEMLRIAPYRGDRLGRRTERSVRVNSEPGLPTAGCLPPSAHHPAVPPGDEQSSEQRM